MPNVCIGAHSFLWAEIKVGGLWPLDGLATLNLVLYLLVLEKFPKVVFRVQWILDGDRASCLEVVARMYS